VALQHLLAPVRQAALREQKSSAQPSFSVA
jgi:hypothetical protein